MVAVTDLFNPAPDTIKELVCSARGCGAEAQWGLLWNNPKLHTAERRKVWLACDDHREHLEQFLGARDFLRGTVPVSELEMSGDETSGPGVAGAPTR
ncbi:MAG TPA: hypothetical protein VIM26_04930 [Pengzhenrongella sp.]